MAKWNEEAAPNNNLIPEIQSSKLVDQPKGHEFSEELADDSERNRLIQRQALNNIK